MPGPLRIAHRGMPRLVTENTLRSFELALEYGAQGIELDVHATADGVIVVHHDPTLDGGARISATPLTALRRLAVDLATLDSVCGLIAGRAELFVEIKGEGIEQIVEASLASYDGPLAIHSFDHALIGRLARSNPGRRLGILVEEGSADFMNAMERSGALDLWPHHPLATPEMVESVHAIGGRVIPWTVNTPQDVARVRALSVDGICTDDIRTLESA
ncbi:glycerophosphodiester phosphodiesterase family protein [soil metagenome]